VTEIEGNLLFDVVLTSGDGSVANQRALFFDINDDTLLSELTVSGADVTDFTFSADKVTTLGGDANINGEVVNELGKFDAGIEFGPDGIETDDIRSTQFTLSHATHCRGPSRLARCSTGTPR
jgi:hypothetical protein